MRTPILVAAAVVAAVQIGAAAVKVQVDLDKAFDFSKVNSWAWGVPEAGWVMAARTPTDDPDAIRRRVEPIVMNAVEAEMPGRGLTPAAYAPDVTVKWYLLLTMGDSAQTIGQFLPGSSAWGMPPFLASTQSLKIIQKGSLAIDFSANGAIVWRGIAAAEIKPELSDDKRTALIREAVREILKRYPQKKK
jgi:uncharacterized protein DUF4136